MNKADLSLFNDMSNAFKDILSIMKLLDKRISSLESTRNWEEIQNEFK